MPIKVHQALAKRLGNRGLEVFFGLNATGRDRS